MSVHDYIGISQWGSNSFHPDATHTFFGTLHRTIGQAYANASDGYRRAQLAARYNRPDHPLIYHHTFALSATATDGRRGLRVLPRWLPSQAGKPPACMITTCYLPLAPTSLFGKSHWPFEPGCLQIGADGMISRDRYRVARCARGNSRPSLMLVRSIWPMARPSRYFTGLLPFGVN